MDTTPHRFTALYRAQFGFVWASLARLGVPSAHLEDALQDVFLVAHRRLPDFEGRSGVRTWLFGIARRVAFRYRRSASRSERKHRAAHRSVDTMPSLGGGRALDLDEVVARKQVGSLVLQALDTLDEDKRAAVVLHVFHELSGPQVAKMLGLEVDTAYSRIKAGRRALRTRLVALGVGEDYPAAVAAARRQTQAGKSTRRRVTALLAVRLPREAGLGWAAVGGAASTVVWKGVVAALAIGVVGVAAARVVSFDIKADRRLDRGTASDESRADSVASSLDVHAALALAPAAGATAADSLPGKSRSPDPQLRREAARHSAFKAARIGAGVTTRLELAAGHPDPPKPPGAGADRLSDEVGLIEAVRGALDRGRGADALRLLAKHAERFPEGQLVTEHAAYRAIALCTAGQTAQGRAEARLFVERHPRAMIIARFQQACALPKENRTSP